MSQYMDFIGVNYLDIENYSQLILRATNAEKPIYLENNMSTKVNGYNHVALMKNEPEKRRNPISKKDIDRLFV